MKTAKEYRDSMMWNGANTVLDKMKWLLAERDKEWKQKIQTALAETSNWNCKEVLTKLLGEK